MGGEQVLAEATEAYRVAFGERLLAAYALGSLAHGGFSAFVSDVDLGLVVRDPLLPEDAETIHAVAERERVRGSSLHERLSVFWGTPATLRGEARGGRFPALDRWDLIEQGRLLAGTDDVRPQLPRPSSAELLTAGAEFALHELAGRRQAGSLAARLRSIRRVRQIDEIRSADLVLRRDVHRASKLALFPVRSLYTAATGRVGSNDAAVASYLERPGAPSRPLVAAALTWRTAPPSEYAAASKLIRDELVPLYLYYIDDYISRLESLAEAELSSAFRQWRDRLVR